MVERFTQDSLPDECRALAKRDSRLRAILDRCGPPPFWHREPGFPAVVRIILEQQVSLASAFAAFSKLEAAAGTITPQTVLALSDEALKGCGFSRQKTRYVRELSKAILSGELDIDELADLPDETVRERLTKVVGIGDWTVNVYLLLCLHRMDVFPVGDLALVKSMLENGFTDKNAPKEAVLAAAEPFRPRRSIFAVLLWHAYISEHDVKIP